MRPETERPNSVDRTAGPLLGVWFVLRLVLLLGCAVAVLVSYGTGSVVPMIVTAALALACSLLDGWMLRLRHLLVPPSGLRARSVIDTWQPVAVFAFLSQLGHLPPGDASMTAHVLLGVLGVGTWVVIFLSRRVYD